MKQSRPSLAVLNEDFPKLRDINNTQDTDGLINYLLTILNIKVSNEDEAQDLKIQMLVVSDFLKSKFGSLTIEEIKEAFKMFVAREFPEIKVFRILDCVSIGEVLQAYIEFRNESLRNYEYQKKVLLESPKEVTDNDKKQIREQFLKMVYDELKLKKFSSDSYLLYDDLDVLGKIKISDIDKKIIYKQQQEKFFKQEKIEISTKYSGTRRILEINNLTEKVMQGKPIEKVKNICKSIVASEYLCKYLDDFETFKKVFENEKYNM